MTSWTGRGSLAADSLTGSGRMNNLDVPDSFIGQCQSYSPA